jgi:DNA-binding NtrC family response regulator
VSDRDRRSPAALPTVPRDSAPSSSHRLVLTVLGRGGAQMPLPDSGELSIGRGEGCAVVVDDPSVSRLHAVLRIDGVEMELTDAGSANGTWVRDRQVGDEPVSVGVGELVRVGDAALIALPARAAPLRPRRALPGRFFEYRVAEECVRARCDESCFAIVRVTGGERLDELLRPLDCMSDGAGGETHLLLCDVTPTEAAAIAERLDAPATVACFPRDGDTADELLDAVRAGETGVVASPSSRGPAMEAVYQLVERVAPSDISVLILGETGVGKERVAEAIHDGSARADRPLLKLNCASFSPELLESELFGHTRGAFTGAHADKAGLLEAAGGGTVFLDEVGDMPAPLQAKLLRVLEERTIRRVGGLESIPIDVRFVSATRRDIESELDERFRIDLFYRLAGVTISVPPLRSRTGEILGLAEHFAAVAAERLGRGPVSLSPAAIGALQSYPWPGNVRELKNAVERAVLLADGDMIDAGSLPDKITRGAFEPANGDRGGLRGEVESLERERIVSALAAAAGNQTRAARALGISRRTLIRRLDRYGIERPRKDQ